MNTKKNDGGACVPLQPMVRLFIVIYDDENGLQCPMMWDEDCEGAICAWYHPGTIASFPTRKDARQAITISTRYAQLRKAQGKPENTDFTDWKKMLRVVEIALPNVTDDLQENGGLHEDCETK